MIGGKQKFLVVDDHAGFRRTIRSFLPAGIVVECSNGGEALACYAAHQPDWVLMDIEMRGVDGFTATRQLKEHFPDALVIIISNHDDEEFRRAASEIGTAGFVHKGQLEQLWELVSAK